MKFKVLAYTFLVPLLLAAILILKIIIPDSGTFRHFSYTILFFLLISFLINRLFFGRKYLTELLIDEKEILLVYLTPLARQQKINIRFLTLTDIELKRKNFLIRDFGSIEFFSKDNEIKFYFLNKDVKDVAEQLEEKFHKKPIVKLST
jgi:hypothetical protein